MVNSKHAFWQALVFTIIIFGIGLMLGFFLESYRAEKVQTTLIDSETNIFDDQLRDRIIGQFDIECDLAIESTFSFADKIYNEAIQLEDYDASSQFSDTFQILHRRYDLLRTLLWTESVSLKEQCGSDFHTVVYLYDSTSEDLDIRSHQRFYSRLLFDIKNAHPDEVMLIPIAADTGLSSVDLLVDNYEITQLPSIIIDETTIITDIVTFEELEAIIFEQITPAGIAQ